MNDLNNESVIYDLIGIFILVSMVFGALFWLAFSKAGQNLLDKLFEK